MKEMKDRIMKTMRTLHLYISLSLLALLAALTACVGEELSRPEGEGRLRLEIASITAEVASSAQTKADEIVPAKTVLTDLPKAEDFHVKVTSAAGEVKFDDLFTQIPKEGIILETAIYTIEVHCGDASKQMTTELPKYFTGSGSASIIPGVTTTTSITAKWGYSAVNPVIEEDLAAHYRSYHLDVKVGETKEPIRPIDGKLPTFYLLAGTDVSIHLAGTNKVNQVVSYPIFTQANLPAATEYTLKLTPDIPVFSFGLDTKLELTYDTNDYLNGTNVSLACGDLSGVPTDLITEWKATLMDEDGNVVRSYTASDFNGGEMQVENDWPYLPQGNYTLRYSYTINGEEVSEERTESVPVTVQPPTFDVEVSAETSYSVYKSKGAAEANGKDGSSIFDIEATVKIDPAILENPNYEDLLLTVVYTTDSGANYDEESNRFKDLAWKKHMLTAVAVFDGGSATASVPCEVTGIPYDIVPGNNPQGWILYNTFVPSVVAGKENYLFMKESTSYVISPQYYIPEGTNILATISAYAYGGLKSYKPDVYIFASSTGEKNDSHSVIRTLSGSGSYPNQATFENITATVNLNNSLSQICVYTTGSPGRGLSGFDPSVILNRIMIQYIDIE